MRRGRRAGWLLLAVVAVAGAAIVGVYSTGPVASLPTRGDEPVLALLGDAEHHDLLFRDRHAPYVVRAEDPSGGALFYFGARHSNEVDDPQHAGIAAAWQEFAPTLALLEGRMGRGFGGLHFAVRGFGEPGLVYALAHRDGVAVYSLEPDLVDRARDLAVATDPHSAAAMLAMRFVWSNARRPYSDAALEEALRKRAVGVLAGVFVDAAAFDAFWREGWFAELGDWRELDGDEMIPRHGRSGLEHAWAIDTELRDVHMTRLLVEQVRAGERVFAVVGRSHVGVEAPALRALLPDATLTDEFLDGEWGRW